MPRQQVTNDQIAALLTRIADLLEAQKENAYRIRSYRTAASSVRAQNQPIASLMEGETAKPLTGLKGIGEKIGGLIEEYVRTGKVELLKELEESTPAEAVEEVEKKHAEEEEQTSIDISAELVLVVDEEYRKKAAAGKLKMIAPRLFNPEGEAWLPLLATEHEGYKFTAMFSNTKRAHELGTTNDWVVVYYKTAKGEGQCTVVTETRGPVKGKRVIRGREKECAAYYKGS